MKTKKPRLHQNPIEYRLLVSLQQDAASNQQALYVEIQTIKEFSSFQYELVVIETIDKSSLLLNIVGLRAPKTNVPTTGTATFKNYYSQPTAIKKIIIQKMDKKENSFSLLVTSKRITIKDKPEQPFVEIIVVNKAL